MPFSAPQLRAWSAASTASAQVVLPRVFELSRPGSVVDVGCLFGAWAATASALGVPDVLGIDGDYVDRTELAIPESRFLARDLTLSLRVERSFDLAICLEVAHYLPRQRAADFVADLCRLAPLVLFSAAIPHQGGNGHVNEQWPAYWAQRFISCGFTPVDCVRDEIWDDPDVGPWYAQNTLLFVDSGVASAAIRDHSGFGRCPARVHPAIFLPYAGGRYHALRRRASRLHQRVR
ncbi:class I SAM-dependent methyltransferase [Solirubrobacter ginsenosidimutans]|uniref:class I SAM-dependent methyltransferase n=1 Tax=Solirubrobacter ginsenosidimutans TaxID=490573 RepID=UPI0022CDCE49|nr:class I SAM-dependent methyltransferase [Solirubrobacter ginsenosidimutans]